MHGVKVILYIFIILIIGACSPTSQGETGVDQSTAVPTLDPQPGFQDESVIIQETAVSPVPTLDPQRVSRGEAVYEQFCAACHGANLEGQPDWQSPLPDGGFPAPPHDSTGHTWHHSDEVILEIIAQGSNPLFGGTMQGFAEVIDDQDRLAVLEFIKSRWGQEEREFQRRITVQ